LKPAISAGPVAGRDPGGERGGHPELPRVAAPPPERHERDRAERQVDHLEEGRVLVPAVRQRDGGDAERHEVHEPVDEPVAR